MSKSEMEMKNLESLPYRDPIIDEVISNAQKEGHTNLTDDILGIIFKRLTRENEKKLGQFYTPSEVVDYMIKYLKIEKDSKILDPTCGCGIFLLRAHKFLTEINKNALNNIYGVDLNESATKIAKINLWLKDKRNEKTLKILERNIKTGNSIVQDKKIDSKAFLWEKEFNGVMKGGGFDFIIGNPPYLTIKGGRDYNLEETNFKRIVNGNTNAASLVVLRSFDLLKEDGTMAFVLPKTLLRTDSYSNLRNYILEKSKILHIYDLGIFFKNVRGEQVVLFAKKTNDKKEISENRTLIKYFKDEEKNLSKQSEFLIPQDTFKKHKNKFLTFESPMFYSLIRKIKNKAENLENLSEIFRGISLSPNSPRITKFKFEGYSPIIKGKNVSKFSYVKEYYIKDVPINKEKVEKLREDKIILQNIFSSESGIIATIDDRKEMNFDTITNIIVKDKRISLDYLLGLLNSKLLNFYLIYAIYNGSKLTMHTDKAYIGKLPILMASEDEQKRISEVVSEIRKSKDKKLLLNELDKAVFNLYDINKKEQSFINHNLKKIMSKKSIW